MSQASQSAPPVATAPQPRPATVPTTGPTTPASANAPVPTKSTADTPQRLRRLSTIVVLTGVFVGLVSALTLAYLASSLARAQADAEQLIRVQKIQTNLLSADAIATNAFLVGGLEPPAQRAAYDAAMTTTSSLITDAARSQSADAEALAALNQEVVGYAAAIEQARANNRQGLPVGAQYLRTASAQLRGTALPILDNLVEANAERAQDEMDVRIGYLTVVLLLLGLAVVVAIQVWVARRFRRTLNPGLLTASVVLLAALIASLIGVQQLSKSVSAIEDGSFGELNRAAAARIEANDAKANESLTLIARGSGQTFEDAWTAAAASVTGNLRDEPTLLDQWQVYEGVHTEIRALDNDGSWDAAVAKATGTGKDSANTTFGTFDSGLAGSIDQAAAETATSLGGRQPGLIVGAIVSLLAGLAAALLGRAGIATRLREYR